MPKVMAIACLGLSFEDIAIGTGTALAVLQPTVRRLVNPQQNGLESSRLIRRNNKIDVISLRYALKLSLEKHASVGGANHIKLLIERYLEQQYPKLSTSNKWTTVTNDCKGRGLVDAIEEEWQNESPSQHWVLTAYMPYLQPKTLPSHFDTGFLCEGCIRNAFHAKSLATRAAARELTEKAYLMNQYMRHLRQCETAQSIFRGERLKMSDENELKVSLIQAVSSFRPIGVSRELANIISGVELDAKPSDVKAAVSNALQRIHRIGNKELQQRTSTKWPTPNCTPGPFGE